MRILLHQQPVARDLREVSAALKMISDMERIGDQASDIADLSKFIEENHVQIPELIGKMAEMTVGMVTESVDAFVKRDLDLCRKVIDDDDQVDDAFNQIKEELAELMYQNLDAKAGLDLLMTAKYMEWMDLFCELYCKYIEGDNPEHFRFSEYKGNTNFAGNRLDIRWLCYNLSLIILKLLHFSGLEDEYNNN